MNVHCFFPLKLRKEIQATGEMHTVREFVETAFAVVGVTIRWEGQNEDEVGYCNDSDKALVKVDKKYYRPTEVEQLLGNATKAREKLGWKPKVTFEKLVEEMVMADAALVAAGDMIS